MNRLNTALLSALLVAVLLDLGTFCWWTLHNATPTIPSAVIRKGVGLAYCSPKNANTEADFALIDAIAREVERESNAWLRRYWR